MDGWPKLNGYAGTAIAPTSPGAVYVACITSGTACGEYSTTSPPSLWGKGSRLSSSASSVSTAGQNSKPVTQTGVSAHASAKKTLPMPASASSKAEKNTAVPNAEANLRDASISASAPSLAGKIGATSKLQRNASKKRPQLNAVVSAAYGRSHLSVKRTPSIALTNASSAPAAIGLMASRRHPWSFYLASMKHVQYAIRLIGALKAHRSIIATVRAKYAASYAITATMVLAGSVMILPVCVRLPSMWSGLWAEFGGGC